MGTSIYKGSTKRYRSIGQNKMIVSKKYPIVNGYFGVASGHHIRNIFSDSPLETALDFYNKIALGGVERELYDGKLRISNMADGSVITMRVKSSSDGSPAVDINISHSKHSGEIKQQKIHFVKENKK